VSCLLAPPPVPRPAALFGNGVDDGGHGREALEDGIWEMPQGQEAMARGKWVPISGYVAKRFRACSKSSRNAWAMRGLARSL